METLRLPRRVEEEPGAAQLARELAARARPLWHGGERVVAHTGIGPQLEAALRSAYSAGRIVRGIEGAERALATEEKGLKAVDLETGVDRGGRVSRILLVADDGSERFYRNVEWLLNRHAPRLLALRIAVDEQALGRLLFGKDAVARALLVTHKDAVSEVLLALAGEWSAQR